MQTYLKFNALLNAPANFLYNSILSSLNCSGSSGDNQPWDDIDDKALIDRYLCLLRNIFSYLGIVDILAIWVNWNGRKHIWSNFLHVFVEGLGLRLRQGVGAWKYPCADFWHCNWLETTFVNGLPRLVALPDKRLVPLAPAGGEVSVQIHSKAGSYTGSAVWQTVMDSDDLR